jgi:hypothetical protein
MEIQITTNTNNVEGTLDTTREFALLLVKSLSIIQMIHWYTKNYDAHIIMGALYDDIKILFDDLQEEIIGTSSGSNVIFPKISFNLSQLESIYNFKDTDCNILNIYYQLYNEITNALTSTELRGYTTNIKSGIQNTIDSVISRLNKTNYLLSLL